SALNGINYFGCAHVYHVERNLSVGHLGHAATKDAKQLMVADGFPTELGHITGDDEGCALELLLLAADASFGADLIHVGPVQHIEAVGLLQMSDQGGFGLVSKAINTVREDAALEARSIIKLAHGNRAALSLILCAVAGHFRHFQ